MNRITPKVLVAAVCAVLAGAALAQGAKVNGREIPASLIDMLVKNQVAQGRQDTPDLRNAVREQLINHEVVAQEAAKKGLDKQANVAAQINFTRQEILFRAYLEDYVRSNPISEDMLKKEYERIKPQLPAKEYRAHHILVEKEDEAKGLIAQIRKGGNFEKLASANSKDQGSKGKGGELDWSPAERYVKPFADALSKLKKGQVTEAPVQTQFGWHIIRLDDERATKVPTFEEGKAELQQMMQRQLLQKAVADLRSKAKIE